jgi:hypothetical protein
MADFLPRSILWACGWHWKRYFQLVTAILGASKHTLPFFVYFNRFTGQWKKSETLEGSEGDLRNHWN